MIIYSSEDVFIQPIIQYIGKKEDRRYDIILPYVFEWSENNKRYRRKVNATVGSCPIDAGKSCIEDTDLASVPKLGGVSGVLGFTPYGASDGASVLHDQAYRCMGKFAPGEFQIYNPEADNGLGAWEDCKEPFPRKRADALYRKMCILGGMSKIKAGVEWASLRVGAWPREGKNFKEKLAWYMS